MPDSIVTLTREQLYEQVWSEPIRTLAKRYGLSDVGLAKTCRRLKIPLPGRGYWAKSAAGHHVKRMPLPVLPPNGHGGQQMIKLEAHPRRDPSSAPGPVIDQAAFEGAVANRIIVAQSLRSPHPLVRSAADLLSTSSARDLEYLYNGRERHLDIQVARKSLSRALRIMDTLLKACESRGWKVSVGSGDDRKSYVLVLGQRVPFGIREKLKKVKNEPAKPLRSGVGQYLSYSSEYSTVPSGQLSLVVRESWGHSVRKSWDESEQCPLEDRLNEFMVGLVARAVEEQEFERRRADNERERREDEEQRRAAQRRREEEATRVRTLEQQAVDWNKSRQLVEYLNALRKQAEEQPGGIAPGSHFTEWLAWATDYALGLNPVPQVLGSNPVPTLSKET